MKELEHDSGIQIQLSRAQADQVVRAVSGMGNMSWLVSQLEELREPVKGILKEGKPSLSRSFLLGLSLLAGFPADGSDLSITDTARMLDMSPSTAHRYVSTLVAAGLLEQDPGTRLYRLAR